jgi:hypothetical protein
MDKITKKLLEDGTNDLNASATSGAYPSVGSFSCPRCSGPATHKENGIIQCPNCGVIGGPPGGADFPTGSRYQKAEAKIKEWKDALPSSGIVQSNVLVGTRVQVSVGDSGIDSGEVGTVVSSREVKTDGRGIPTNVEGAYDRVDWTRETAVKLDNGRLITMFNNRLHVLEAKLREDGPWGPGKGVGGWPLGPSTHFPNEQSVHCPKCDSNDISFTGTSLRPEVTGFLSYNACNSCGYMTFYDERTHEVVHSSYKGKQEGKMDRITRKLLEDTTADETASCKCGHDFDSHRKPEGDRSCKVCDCKKFTKKAVESKRFREGYADEAPCKNCGHSKEDHMGDEVCQGGDNCECADYRSIDESKHRIRETGEMGMSAIQSGGEFYGWAEDIENAAREICSSVPGCSFQEMRPFDVYQGPYASLQCGGRGAKLWSNGDEGGNYYLEFNGTTSNAENGRGWQGDTEEISIWLAGQLGHKSEAKLREAAGLTIGPNQFVHIDSDGDEVFYSYNTPVGAFLKGRFYQTDKQWSATTSRHIKNYFDGCIERHNFAGINPERKPQEFFDAL